MFDYHFDGLHRLFAPFSDDPGLICDRESLVCMPNELGIITF